MQRRPTLWTTATIKGRYVDDASVTAYFRRYALYAIVGLTLAAPLLVVLVEQWAPPRPPVVAAAATARRESASLFRASVGGASASGPSRVETTALDTSAPDALRPLGWYRQAASQHGVSPHVLEALHQYVSGGAPDGCIQSGGPQGAVGPLQFQPTTFDAYADDANGDGETDVCSFVDSLFAAARYLRALGADADIESAGSRHALAVYGVDPRPVLDLARAYRARDAAGPPLPRP